MVRPTEKAATTTHHNHLAKGVVATLTAVALAASPIGEAAALSVVRGENADSSAYQADIAGWGIDVDEVIREAYMQGVAGTAALQSYLNGLPISEESALGIDADALRSINYEIAVEIYDLQNSIREGTYAPEEQYEEVVPDTSDDIDYPVEPEPTVEESTVEDTVVENETPVQNESTEAIVQEQDSAPQTTTEIEIVIVQNDAVATDDANADAADDEAGETGYPQWTYSGDTTYTAHNIGVNMTTEKFVAMICEQARKIGQEYDLYASVMIAQAILESGSGSSSLAATYNNLFGIKGHYEGEGVVMRTNEDDGTGTNYSIYSTFRSYPSTYESLLDYADLLTVSMADYYSPAWKSNTDTFVDACDYLQGHYATDTSYSAKLQDLIETYDLTRYDDPLDYEMVDTYEVALYDEKTGEALIDESTGKQLTEERDLVDLVNELTSHLGDDYVWGGTTPGAFDCSGLVQYSYRKALGIELPRTTYYQCLEGEDVDFDDLHMGDLLFFVDSNGLAGHVAVYLAEGCYIEAPHTGDVVKITSMSEKKPTFAKRIVETRDVDAPATTKVKKTTTTTAAATVAATTTTADEDVAELSDEGIEALTVNAIEAVAGKVADSIVETIEVEG